LSGFGTGDHMLPEMARVLDAIVSHRAGRVSCVTAGELQGLSERHFRRLRDAYEDRGEEGLVDRRRGRSEFVSGSRRGGGVIGGGVSDAVFRF
jgi:Helix-turn-helix domain